MTACPTCGNVTYRVRVVQHEGHSTLIRECLGCGRELAPTLIEDAPVPPVQRP